MRATITSIAHCVPPEIVGNEAFAHLGVSDEWIYERTGIRERRILRGGATSDMVVPAAQACLARAGLTADDIDCVLCATLTPDRITPPMSCTIQHRLGIERGWGFDISGACSGFSMALVTAARFVETGTARRVLLCAAETMTRVTNYTDPKTAPLFGDGAAVLLIEQSIDDSGLIDQVLRTNAVDESLLMIIAGGSRKPACAESVANNEHGLMMDGRAVYKAAVPGMIGVITELLKRNNMKIGEVDWVVPHQANARILEAVADRLGCPMSKVMVNIDRFGNTSAATIPICLSEWYEAGKLKRGDKVMLCSFGAGYILAGVYLKWGMDFIDVPNIAQVQRDS
jgi:3-oxoacyl-[acyl-carrier-protein] synthase-3